MTDTISAPSQLAGEPRWEIPEPVERPDASALTSALAKASATLGMRAAGWVVLLVAVIAAVAGGVLAWQELRLVALLCGVLLVIALLFTVAHPRLQVGLSVDNLRVVVGQQAAGTLVVANAAKRRNLPARIDLPIGQQSALFTVPSLASGQQRTDRFTIPTSRRGVLQIGPAHSVQGDPFALTGREMAWTDSMEVFVHPRTVPLAGRMTGFIHDLEGHATPKTAASDMSFQSLREYAPGDDRRQVHWRTSAHLGELMVRQYEQTLQSRVGLGIDLTTTSYLGEDDFEDAVSVAASVGVQAIREQNPLSVLTNRQVLPAVSGPRLLDEMSRLQRVGRSGLGGLARFVLRMEPQASVVVLVTGAGVSLDELRRTCLLFDLDTRVVGVQVDPQARVTVRNIANQSLVRLPELADLARAMRLAMP